MRGEGSLKSSSWRPREGWLFALDTEPSGTSDRDTLSRCEDRVSKLPSVSTRTEATMWRQGRSETWPSL